MSRCRSRFKSAGLTMADSVVTERAGALHRQKFPASRRSSDSLEMTVTALPTSSVLPAELEGSLHYDATMRKLYATDASVYREIPQAVALPRNEEDIRKLVRFARDTWDVAHTTDGRDFSGGTSRRSPASWWTCHVTLPHLSRLTPRGIACVQPGVVRKRAKPCARFSTGFSSRPRRHAEPVHDSGHGGQQRLRRQLGGLRRHARASRVGASGS